MFAEDQVTISKPFTNADWAERFGRRAIDGMIANLSIEYIEQYARLAASYARLHMEQQQQHTADVLAWYPRFQ